ncbi:MAG: Uma2 family endonuclease [Phaeodactylibacter sp.]|nr:Uma2 family endonuclease [Phaeodactylibacter sp.]
MATASPAQGKAPEKKKRRGRREPLPKTLEEFLQWNPEGGFKYEWNNGALERSVKMITPRQLYLVYRLAGILEKVKPKAGGRLICEVQNRTSDTQIRVPDIAYYTNKEISQAAEGDFQPVTSFAIEIISEHDKINTVQTKIEEYFQAGVKVIWLIFPEFQKVYVYTGPEKVAICKGDAICSGEAAIPGFSISATELFRKS